MPPPPADDPAETTPDAAEARANVLLARLREDGSWTADEAAEAETLLKRLRRGAEPHASLLESLETAGRSALDGGA